MHAPPIWGTTLKRKKSDLKYSVSYQTLILPDLPGFKTVIFTPLGHLHIKQLHLLSLCDFMHSLWLRITKIHLLLMQHSHLECTIALYSGKPFQGFAVFLHLNFMCCCDQNAWDVGKTKNICMFSYALLKTSLIFNLKEKNTSKNTDTTAVLKKKEASTDTETNYVSAFLTEPF